jgi:hypothetical protein
MSQGIIINSLILEAIANAMRDRTDLSFWGMSRAIRTPVTKESNARFGSWFAETPVGDRGEHFGIACSIQPGEVKVGIALSKARSRDTTDEEIRGVSPDYRMPDIIRPVRALTLYDWVYRKGALKARWFHRAAEGDASAQHMLSSVIASLVVNTWKGAASMLAQKYKVYEKEYVITAPDEIDLPRMMQEIDGWVDQNDHHAKIGHMVVLSTNESLATVEAIVSAICPSASVLPC